MKRALKITFAVAILSVTGISGYMLRKHADTDSPIVRIKIVNDAPGDLLTIGQDGTVYVNGQAATEVETIVEKQYKVAGR